MRKSYCIVADASHLRRPCQSCEVSVQPVSGLMRTFSTMTMKLFWLTQCTYSWLFLSTLVVNFNDAVVFCDDAV